MRHSEFWSRLEKDLGSGYAMVWADSHVMSILGGRTASEALDAGEDPKTVWRAVHAERGLPASER